MLNINESFIFDKELDFDNKTKYSNVDVMSIFKKAENYIQKNKKRQVIKFHEFKLFLGKKGVIKAIIFWKKKILNHKQNFFQMKQR